MAQEQQHVSKEVKEQILKQIQEEGLSIAEVAKAHGLKPRNIYGWISPRFASAPSLAEVAKLKRENLELKKLIGPKKTGH